MKQISEANQSTQNGKKLIYIIGTYPLLTTTFIDREILQLQRWNIDLQVVSIRRPPSDIPLSEVQLELQKDVLYLLPVSVVKLILSQLFFSFVCPRIFFGTLIFLLTRPHPNFLSRLKTLLHFSEGVYGAYLLREQHFTEFQAHFIDRAATLALVMGRLLDKPYTLSIHAAEDIFVHPVLLDEKITESRHAVTCTLYNKKYIETLLSKDLDHKISYIPHGLDIHEYQPEETNVKKNNLILAVGQLAERKGFKQLIDGCRILKNRDVMFQCQIIGQGPQWEILMKMINKYSLEDCVTLSGALPHEAVVDYYAKASMLVMPCIQSKNGNLDGIPNVLFEAMAMEVPVISTRISAIPELIEDGVNGMLVTPRDPVALADAMEILIQKPQEAIRLGQHGRLTVLNEFDAETNVGRFAMTLWPEWIR
jgi:glycosyltransferase involved in cell wall biosynthesis